MLCGQLEGHPYRDVFSTVYSDDEEGGRFAAHAMKERERKDIVAVLRPQDNPAVVDRLPGYRAVLGEDLPRRKTLSIPAGNSGDGNIRPCADPRGEITVSMACSAIGPYRGGVITALNEAGLSVVPATFLSSASRSRGCGVLHPRASRPSASPLREEGHMAANIALDIDQGR